MTSIGLIGERFKRTADDCRKTMVAFNVRPTLVINDVPYFDRVQVARFAELFGDGSTHQRGIGASEIDDAADQRARQF